MIKEPYVLNIHVNVRWYLDVGTGIRRGTRIEDAVIGTSHVRLDVLNYCPSFRFIAVSTKYLT